jgi:hypothetical protein
MIDLEDALMESILSVLSEKIDIELLQKANTRGIRKRLLRVITNELIYKLLVDKRVDLSPGFGSLVLKEIREKDKKVYDRISKTMVIKHVRGSKVVYKPGDVVKEFL